MTRPASRRRRNQWKTLTICFAMVGMLLAVPAVFSQDTGKTDAGAALRKDPQYPQLYRDAKAFYALPPTTQKLMRQLYDDLEKQAPAERDGLKSALTRYADWLDKLSEADRQKIMTEPNLQTRLQMVKELRDKQWLDRQPLAVRQYLDRLPKTKPTPAVAAASILGVALMPPRTMRPLNVTVNAAVQMTDWYSDAIKTLKKEEARKLREWQIATRHWKQLTDGNPKSRTMPSRPAEFGDKVETFIREYLTPVLSDEERYRLKAAEGKWPLYPMTLVDLADRHPMALPQAHGPKTMAELPSEVRENVNLAFTKMQSKELKKKKQDPDKYFNDPKYQVDPKKFGAIVPTPSMKFASGVARFVHDNTTIQLPYELWAVRAADMSVPMQVFLDPQGAFFMRLSADEQKQLRDASIRWPDYPLKIQELAAKHGMRPPWFALPKLEDKGGDIWDKFRVKPRNKWDPQPPPPVKGKGKGIGKDKEADERPRDGLEAPPAGLVWQEFHQPRFEPETPVLSRRE